MQPLPKSATNLKDWSDIQSFGKAQKSDSYTSWLKAKWISFTCLGRSDKIANTLSEKIAKGEVNGETLSCFTKTTLSKIQVANLPTDEQTGNIFKAALYFSATNKKDNQQPLISSYANLTQRVEAAQKAALATAPIQQSPVYRLLGGTSDHTWKTYTFSFADNASIKVGTWNLMDQCTAPNGNFPGNNPLGIEEDLSAYEARKRAQIAEISSMILGNGNVSNLSAMVFQEVDFCYRGLRAMFNESQGRTLDERQKIQLELYKLFQSEVEKAGWKILTTDPRADKKAQDPLVMIYNPSVLKTDSSYLRGCFPQKNPSQLRAAEATFTHIASREKLAITNLHLDFATEPEAAIDHYQKKQIASNLPTIALGDLNRPPNKVMSYAVADWNHPTNVDASSRGDHKTLSLKDGKFNKVYDSALVSPGGSNKSVTLVENEMTYFEFKDSKNPEKGLRVKTRNVNIPHTTLPGRAWRRNKDLLKQLEEERKNAKTDQERNKISQLIVQVQNKLPPKK